MSYYTCTVVLFFLRINFLLFPVYYLLGSSLGTGTYFANQISTSAGYGKSVILARVLTGIYAPPSARSRPNLQNIHGYESQRIHSVADNIDHPSIFVIFNDNSAYPEYILHFQ